MGVRDLERPFDKHIDEDELNALVTSSARSEQKLRTITSAAIRDLERHVKSCVDCRGKVEKYRQLVNRSSNVLPETSPPGADCPKSEDVDWHEVASGLWPELKGRQLILCASLWCECGPRLRAATSVDDDPTAQEEELLAQLKPPSRPVLKANRDSIPSEPVAPLGWRRFLRWELVVPAVALIVLVGVLRMRPPSSPTSLSGTRFAEFAVNTHRQHVQGSLALDVHMNSQQALNQWFKTTLKFPLALPASPAAPGVERPYRLEGARLVPVGSKTAAYIAYQMATVQMQSAAVGLLVTPDSITKASGGVIVDFKKVSFHYAMGDGYKVGTWSLHGLTYALVSHGGTSTQRSR